MQRLNILLLLLAMTAGCASSTADRGSFDDVQRLVEERTQGRVQWNSDSAADRAADQAVEQMLANELTIDTAVQIAMLNNRNLQATFEDLGIAQADLVAAGLLKNPIFEGDLLFSTSGGGTGVELTVLQDFLDILWIPMRKRIAAAGLEAAKLRVAGAAIDLAGDVRRTCIDLQAAQQLLELRKTAVEAATASSDLANRLHDAGNITDLDLATEQAQREQAQLNASAAELRAIELRERLGALMGISSTDASNWKIAPKLAPLPQEEPATEQLEMRAIERSLDLAEARERVMQLAERLGIARSTALFDGAQFGAKGQREVSGGWSVGPAFAIPIPLFDQGQTKIAATQAQLRQAQQRYAATSIEIESEVRAAQARLKFARDRVLTFERALLPLRERILEQAQRQFNAMTVNVFQLLQARQLQIDAGAQHIDALRDYWQARVMIQQIVAGRRVAIDGGP